MSLEDDYADFLSKDEPAPEQVFNMTTIVPKRRIRVTAHLEDKDGEKVLISEIAENLVKYVNDNMKELDNNPVNAQMFPLCASFMTSIVPRFVGLKQAYILFEARSFREALLSLSLSSVLFMQYIEQHGLKIVTETTEISQEEVEEYLRRSDEADQRLQDTFKELIDKLGSSDEPEDN